MEVGQHLKPLVGPDHLLIFGVDAALLCLIGLGFALALRRRLDALEAVACFDPLTRTRNGWLFAAELGELGRSAERAGQLVSLIYFDLDHFRALNAHGHRDVGDRALQLAARLMAGAQRRASDRLYRLYSGGDEFALIMVGAASDQARAQAWNILVALQLKGLSASAGVACSSETAWSALELEADRACQDAKKLGRGRVVAAGQVPS